MPFPETTERIAIVGVGGMFPGAPDLATFWHNIAEGIDSGRSVPDGRWYLSASKAYAPWPPQPDRVYSTWGCFIEGFSFDPEGLNLDPELLARLDPMFHLGLHAARSAYCDAGLLRGIDHARVGVILGNIALPTESTSAMCRDVLGRTFVEKLIDTAAAAAQTAATAGMLHGPQRARARLADPQYSAHLKASLRQSHWHPLNRFAAGLPASLIAEGLGLGGIAFTLDAACASSLYSLKFAVEELLSHRADAMLAGGMSRPDCQYTQMGFAQLQALSRRGRCAPLSSEADGLVVGEGAGVFVLKRLGDAVSAGDRIYGVIAGIGLSNDRGANLLAPHSEGQLRAMRDAYQQAGWKPSDVDLIECHATGTPVGDAVEIASLHQLWERESYQPHQCVIGGVKSNVGHLLTGAGAAGLMKVLLALKHQTLPPTANFTRPAAGLASPDSPFQVLSRSTPWNRRGQASGVANGGAAPIPRRATINAFGFGGINAHVLIEEWNGPLIGRQDCHSSAPGPVQVAIVGIDAQVGKLDSKEFVLERITAETSPASELRNWWGVDQTAWFQREQGHQPSLHSKDSPRDSHAIPQVRLPIGAYRIPPLEMQDMLPQQQLMLKVAAGAIRDSVAHEQSGGSTILPESGANRTGIFVGIELDPNTTNFHFRWAIEQDASQWAEMLGLDLSSEELSEWIRELKDAAGPPLSPNRVMGNLGGVVASRLAREFDIGGPSFTISCGGDSGRVAFELATQFLQRGELDAALIGAVDFTSDVRTMLRGSARPLDNPTEVIPHDAAIGFLLRRQEDAVRVGDRIYAAVFASSAGPPEDFHGSKQRATSFLDDRATRAMESLLKSALSSFHRHDGVTPLLRNRANRRISFGCQAVGICLEPVDQPLTPTIARERFGRPGDRQTGLIVVSATTRHEFVSALAELERLEQTCGTLDDLARQWHCQRRYSVTDPFLVAVVAADRQNLSQAIAEWKVWSADDARFDRTTARSFIASAFRNDAPNQLAFVFPGSGSGFPGMGQELLVAFPEVLDRQDRENQYLERQYRPQSIWSHDGFAELLLDHKTLIFTQVAMGTAICDLLELFGVHPSASIGYSLGESSALFGLRAWIDRDEMLMRMERSPLFGSDLVAPFDAARRAWNVRAGELVPWVSGVIDRSATEVRRAIERIRIGGTGDSGCDGVHLYLLIINTPRQCVVGGDRALVDRMVRDLNATFVPFASPSTVHCGVLRQVEDAYRQLHLMPTTPPTVASGNTDPAPRRSVPIRFYSTGWGRTYNLSRESAAEAIVAQAVDTIDFPRVIEQAYADGVRMFVEIGPGSSCTKMIDEILVDRPHLARAALPITSCPIEAFYEVLAALIVERVPVDLSYLYGRSTSDNANEARPSPSRDVVTRVGGLPFRIPAPASGWRFEVVPVVEPAEPSWCDCPGSQNLLDQFQLMINQRTQAHEAFLRFSAKLEHLAAEQLALLSQARTETVARFSKPCVLEQVLPPLPNSDTKPPPRPVTVVVPDEPPKSLTREQCMEFAIGKIGHALGRKFAEIDQHPTRVRLPDEPLMLVDRILNIEGEPLSMTSGRVVTEHDIHPGAWYLDCGRIPTCIAVESGQADLFLSGWLGIDLQTKGLACYRLLDAVVTFHDALPQVGKTIHYDIRVLHFFRQGDTYLFRFEFDATVDGQPLLTMREGCAGFFTEAELAGGKGIVHTALDKRPRPGVRPADWSDPVPMAVESYDDSQLLALRRGDLAACFGPAFAGLPLANPVTIPGLCTQTGSDPFPLRLEFGLSPCGLGSDPVCVQSPSAAEVARSRMWLIDRVLKLDPVGGKFGMGSILGELDIHSDDWFLTCHFCDDQVMPGTLMYECCLHTLRIYLLRMGWIGEAGQIVYEPIPGIRSRLKCRGQVLAGTKKVWYEVTLKEVGYGKEVTGAVTSDERKVTSKDNEDAPVGQHSSSLVTRHSSLSASASSLITHHSSLPFAYCLADALMYADGKPIVEITDMSVRLTGLTREAVERLWAGNKRHGTAKPTMPVPQYDRRPAIFDTDRITAFAIGNPSEAFGDRYRVFDAERRIARLPGPPFQFLDRIVSIQNCQQWVLQPGGKIVAQYDVPVDAWYFGSNRQPTMPFAVLLETALQPCGWLAAYLGSALTSEVDISFRNLGGSAIQHREVSPQSGTLTTTVKMTRVSNSAGMIIQHYDFDLRCQGEPVYVGNTYFGFFAKSALANQIGIRDAAVYQPTAEDRANARLGLYPQVAPFPDPKFRMIQTIDCLAPAGGPLGWGCVVGTMPVDPSAWFFKAHFYQDPVVPGSLGLESFWQLLKVYAADRWQLGSDAQFSTPSLMPGSSSTAPPKHEWVYRGQVIPADRLVTVNAVIKHVDDAQRLVTAEGFLSVDGRVIYQMKDFMLGVV